MKKWAKRGLWLVLAAGVLWLFMQFCIGVALSLSLNYGANVGLLFVLLAWAALFWLVWWLEANWGGVGRSERPGRP